ncbi:hypothetical protein [Nostoc commune]|nr:hypothetical protein [Nostoc commune]
MIESTEGIITLQIPENIILLFQPPHTPQVNPIERFWEEIKIYLIPI